MTKETHGTKEKQSRETIRKRYDDEGGFFFVPSFGAPTEIEALEAHLRLSSAIEAAKQKQK